MKLAMLVNLTLLTILDQWDRELFVYLFQPLPYQLSEALSAKWLLMVIMAGLFGVGFLQVWVRSGPKLPYLFSSVGSLALAVGVYGISNGILKPFVGRVRPCHHQELMQELMVSASYSWSSHCDSLWGMPSNHACFFFTLAAASFVLLQWRPLRFLWLTVALLVGVSRVIHGVHYPGDVLMGALMGVICGAAGGFLLRWLGCSLAPQKS